MFDVCDRGSFDAVPNWFRDFDLYTVKTSHAILVGCKSDKSRGGPYVHTNRTVNVEEARALAAWHSTVYLECSVKNGQGIFEVVSSAVTAARKMQGPLAEHTSRQQQQQQRGGQRSNRGNGNCMQRALHRAMRVFS